MATAIAPERSAAKPKRPEPKEFIFKLLNAQTPEQTQSSTTRRVMLAMTDEIYWPYKSANDKPVGFDEPFDAKDVYYSVRQIRYIYGEKSIFIDEQEKQTGKYEIKDLKNRFLDNPANRDMLQFHRAEIRVTSEDTALRNYLWCKNQCQNQYLRAKDKNGNSYKRIMPEYYFDQPEKRDEEKTFFGSQRDKAYETAKTARNEEMLPHARHLQINFNHEGTDEPKDIAALKEEYKEYAFAHPDKFLKTFNDPQIKVQYQIRDLVENQNEITFLKVPGQAHWMNTGALITNIPADRDPVEYLAEFSITKEGEEFDNLLRAFKK